jgi:hypothetical protein
MSVIVRWRMRDDKRGPRAIAYQLHLTLRRTRCSGGVSEGRPATYRRVRDFGGKLTPVARSVTATLTLGLSETYQSMIHMAAVFLPLSGSLKLRGELLLGVSWALQDVRRSRRRGLAAGIRIQPTDKVARARHHVPCPSHAITTLLTMPPSLAEKSVFIKCDHISVVHSATLS